MFILLDYNDLRKPIDELINLPPIKSKIFIAYCSYSHCTTLVGFKYYEYLFYLALELDYEYTFNRI